MTILLLIGFVSILLISIHYSRKKRKCEKQLASQGYICTTCGTINNKPQKLTKGSMGIEVILWLMFLVPGMLYSIWRLSGRDQLMCHCCKGKVIPVSSPFGQRLLKGGAK